MQDEDFFFFSKASQHFNTEDPYMYVISRPRDRKEKQQNRVLGRVTFYTSITSMEEDESGKRRKKEESNIPS